MKKIFYLFIFLFFNNINAQFNEVASTIGIDHLYIDLANMGGGAVFFDYDNDGWDDLYMTSGFDEDVLYKNNGDGTFTKIINIGFSITDTFNTMAVVAGDVNNDGNRDLFVTSWREDNNLGAYGRNLLFINNGDGTFTEDGLAWGLTDKSFTMGAAMLDYNQDGYLDIYAVNYQETNAVTYDTNGEINGFAHQCFENFFYENNGDGTFTEKAVTLGVNNDGCALAVMPTDFDQDGDQDIYLANDFGEFIVPNTLYRNNHVTGVFEDKSVETNMNVGVYGMGLAYGDIDKDGDFDYYITNLGRNVLLQNDGNQLFSDISTSAGVGNAFSLEGGGLFTTSWGTAFLDVNNDTWPDLFVANGRVPAAPFIATGEDDPNMLFINNGDLTFTGEQLSADNKNHGRGMAYSDYDKDGDLDMVVVVQKGSVSANPKTVFFQNQLNPNGSDGKNWVQFSLEGVSINKDAMGAKVILTVNGEKLIQEVHGQGSHGSQHSLVLHFGLAANTVIEKAEIIWSSSSQQVFTNLGVNKRFDLVEGETLGVENFEVNNNIYTYPNPTQDKLFIANLKKEAVVLISTIEGKTIKKEIVNLSSNELDISGLSNGLYLVRVYNDQQSFSKIFVKN